MCGGSSFHPRRFLAGVPRSTSSGSVNLWIHRLRRTFGSVFGCGCGGWWSVLAAPLYRYLYALWFLRAAPSAVSAVPCAVPGAFGGALFERISGDAKNPRFRRTGDYLCARGDLNPHPLIRGLAPQASASAYSATRAGDFRTFSFRCRSKQHVILYGLSEHSANRKHMFCITY